MTYRLLPQRIKLTPRAASVAPVSNEQDACATFAQNSDYTLTLKMTSEMRDDIDRALILVQDTRIRSRSEFIRAACQCMLDGLAGGCGDTPVSVEERKERVFSGTGELDSDRSNQVPAENGDDCPPSSVKIDDHGRGRSGIVPGAAVKSG